MESHAVALPWRRALCALLLVAPNASSAQDTRDAPCPEPAAHEFDFWIGDWTIRQKILRPDGSWLELPASTSVTPAAGGCALVERWRGDVQFFWEGMTSPAPVEGLSVRAYDPATRRWAIHWLDSRMPTFGEPYTGTFTNGRGEFLRVWTTPDGPRTGRITFTDVTPRSVQWALAISSDNGRTWQTLWTMAMRRTDNRPR